MNSAPLLRAFPREKKKKTNRFLFLLGSTERHGSPNLFEITDRVEMGQMASMFFNKGGSAFSRWGKGRGRAGAFLGAGAAGAGVPPQLGAGQARGRSRSSARETASLRGLNHFKVFSWIPRRSSAHQE